MGYLIVQWIIEGDEAHNNGEFTLEVFQQTYQLIWGLTMPKVKSPSMRPTDHKNGTRAKRGGPSLCYYSRCSNRKSMRIAPSSPSVPTMVRETRLFIVTNVENSRVLEWDLIQQPSDL